MILALAVRLKNLVLSEVPRMQNRKNLGRWASDGRAWSLWRVVGVRLLEIR